MLDPNNNLNDLLGTLPSLADLAELYWKTASDEVLHIAHRAVTDVLQLVQPDQPPIDNELNKLSLPQRMSWRRE